MIRILVLLITMHFSFLAKSQQALAADEILKKAYVQAKEQSKKVFVIFHASWCAPCKKLDSSMNHSSVKAFFDNAFVKVHLTVFESKGKETRENPGALDLFSKFSGLKEHSLPFWIIFDEMGNFLADAQITKGVNVGCPSEKEEIAFFVSVLKKTTVISEEQVNAVINRFSNLPVITIREFP